MGNPTLMRILSTRTGLAGATLVAILALAACGGGTATTEPTDGTPAPTDAAPTAAEATPTTDPAAPTDAGAIPSFDLSGMLSSLDGIDSYRVTITSNGVESFSSVVVTKPVLAREIMTNGQRIVIIGEEAWIDPGTGTLEPVQSQLIPGLLGLYDPALLVGAFAQPGAMLGAEQVGSEEKNGVQTRHIRIDAGSFVGTIASMPPGSAIDIWVAEDGDYLVSMSVTGVGTGDFTMDVTGVNDPANVIERPS